MGLNSTYAQFKSGFCCLQSNLYSLASSILQDSNPYKVVLIDGDELARLMILHSVGVRIVETMYYKKIDDEYFPDE